MKEPDRYKINRNSMMATKNKDIKKDKSSSERQPKQHHNMSLNEFGFTVDMTVVLKAGFRVWVKGAKNGVGSHTKSEWKKLYQQFLTSK